MPKSNAVPNPAKTEAEALRILRRIRDEAYSAGRLAGLEEAREACQKQGSAFAMDAIYKLILKAKQEAQQ